jgi:hypothetical protein
LQVSALVSVALGGYLIVDTAGQIAYGLQVKNWGGGTTAARHVASLAARCTDVAVLSLSQS